jgi:hypothetical protein
MTQMTSTMRFGWVTLLLAMTPLRATIALAQDETRDAGTTTERDVQKPSAIRTWQDRSGRYRVEAELLAVQGSEVRLRRTDGRVFTIRLDRLSRADREYVRGRVSHRGDSDSPDRSDAASLTSEYTPAPSAADRRVYAILNQRTSLAFEDIGLAELADRLQEEFGVQVVLRVRGTASQVRLSARERNVPLKAALTRMFERTRVGFLVADGVLIIVPRAELEQRFIERTYAAAELTSDPQDLSNLIVALTTACRPESWSFVGGAGDVSAMVESRQLRVRQSLRTHQEVVDFLEKCHQMWETSRQENSISQLVQDIESDDKQTRAAACYTLGRLGPRAKEAVPGLVRALGETQGQFSGGLAGSTLMRIGEAALPELTKAANSDNPVIAGRAKEALNQVLGNGSTVGGGQLDR